MGRKVYLFGSILVVLVVIGVTYILRPPEEASSPVQAIPLDITEPVEANQNGEQPPPAATTEMADPTATVLAPEEAATDEPAPTDVPAVPAGALSGTALLEIDQEASTARFYLGEVLRGNPTTVVGSTDQVAGQIQINFDRPAASQVGVIIINARTFLTDSSQRNRVINNQILDTADYEFITFTPTSLAGLPEFVVPGEEVAFQINGDLTIRDITQPVTFEVVVTADSETSIAGLATAVVQRADFGLVIPSVPGVADVTEDVELELDFTASVPVQ